MNLDHVSFGINARNIDIVDGDLCRKKWKEETSTLSVRERERKRERAHVEGVPI